MGGGSPFTPQIVIPGWTEGGMRALWVSEHPPWRMNIESPLLTIKIFGTLSCLFFPKCAQIHELVNIPCIKIDSDKQNIFASLCLQYTYLTIINLI